MRIQTSILALLAATALTACSGGDTATKVETKAETKVASVTLDDVLAHPRRAEETARDKFRNPKGTLEFFEVGPGKRCLLYTSPSPRD